MPLIVAHGLPKSGSTFLYKVAKDASQVANGISHYKAKEQFFSPRTIPDFIYDLGDDDLDFILRQLPARKFFVLKTHGRLSSRLQQHITAGAVIAFTSYRDPRDTIVAMLEAGTRDREAGAQRAFAKLRTIEDAVRPAKVNFQRARPWFSHTGVEAVPFYLIAANQKAAIHAICRHIGLERCSVRLEFFYAHKKSERITEFNKGIQDRFLYDLPPAEVLALTDLFRDEIAEIDRLTAPAMRRHGYQMLYNHWHSQRDESIMRLRATTAKT